MTTPPHPHGYGYGGHAYPPPPPPPPKPGVIPLAPLDFGAVLSGAFATFGRHWRQLLGVTGAAYGIALLLFGAALGVAYAAVGDHLPRVFDLPAGQEPDWEDIRPLLIAFACVWLFALIVMFCTNGLVAAACPAVVQEAVLGRSTTFGAVWRRSWTRLPAVLGSVFLSGLAALLPALCFFGGFAGMMAGLITAARDGTSPTDVLILPVLGLLGALVTAPLTVWLWVKFCLSQAAVVMEGQGAVASLRRSSLLVRDSWWRVFGCTLLAAVMAAVVNGAIQQGLSFLMMVPMMGFDPSTDSPASVIATFVVLFVLLLLGQLVGQALVSVFPPLVTSLLYVDQRIRKENLAPELARAAGVPHFGP
ncbi:oxidoreductase [Streptomyces sp. NPDC001744]|uniref:DUF7847 domain-containing protein n=1 Tax=Streptomyces sp. NPDC001744 TaxID=3364606 RepID=UPI00368BD949